MARVKPANATACSPRAIERRPSADQVRYGASPRRPTSEPRPRAETAVVPIARPAPEVGRERHQMDEGHGRGAWTRGMKTTIHVHRYTPASARKEE